ncbi:aminoacyl-tRNA hydrolase [Niveibacterium terrae]|uniref:aminoacyl-tRNA hydrolase n=1 Tax=Niveibacterium terrae TaxID=3373598 RepID=UPI003A9066F3
MTPVAPKLIVGLGNPGAEYVETRHNAGFWFCEMLARELGVTLSAESRFHGLVGNARSSGVHILLPQTFMNNSGQSVGALAHFFRILPSEILVVHDELDIPPGQLKLKCGGGNGGHNGLKSIQSHLSSPDFWRLRIGVGHPGDRNRVVDWVLHRPGREEQDLIDESIGRALDAWPLLAQGQWEKATQTLNSKPKLRSA